MNALLQIDVQNDYFPGGRCELEGADAALQQIQRVLDRFPQAGLPVVHVQHVNIREGAGFFLPGTGGVELHAALTPRPGEMLVVKHAPNSFYWTNLWELLRERGIDQLTVCGMMTHMCVDTTVRAAKDLHIPITLLYDACATKNLRVFQREIPAQTVHDAYMAGLDGMFARVLLADQLAVE